MNKLYADELKAESEKMRRGEAYDRRVTVSAHALLAMLERCDRLLSTIQSASGNDASRCIQIDRDSIRALIQQAKGE